MPMHLDDNCGTGATLEMTCALETPLLRSCARGFTRPSSHSLSLPLVAVLSRKLKSRGLAVQWSLHSKPFYTHGMQVGSLRERLALGTGVNLKSSLPIVHRPLCRKNEIEHDITRVAISVSSLSSHGAAPSILDALYLSFSSMGQHTSLVFSHLEAHRSSERKRMVIPTTLPKTSLLTVTLRRPVLTYAVWSRRFSETAVLPMSLRASRRLWRTMVSDETQHSNARSLFFR
jgi:hypothetical protein